MQSPLPPERSENASADAARADASPAEPRVVPVIEEALNVERRLREARLRVRKVVHEEPVTVDEPLREERVAIERVPIDRPLDAPVDVRHEGDVTIVPIVEERLVVSRRLVLVEEVRITRRVETRRDPQQVVLRREEAIVERLDADSGLWHAVAPDATGSVPPVPAGSNAGSTAAPPDPAASRVSQGTHPSGTATIPSR